MTFSEKHRCFLYLGYLRGIFLPDSTGRSELELLLTLTIPFKGLPQADALNRRGGLGFVGMGGYQDVRSFVVIATVLNLL